MSAMRAMPADHGVLAMALEYGERGLFILPVWEPVNGICACPAGASCKSPGKHPRTPDGQHDATCDAATIRDWWTRWPTANVGLALKPSGLIALDVDTTEGHATLEALNIGETARQRSGSGNLHVIAKQPGFEIRGSYKGITLRGNNYIVVAPSVHKSGGIYKWITPPWRCEPITLPDEIVNRFRRAAPQSEGSRREQSSTPSIKRARAWLAKAEASIQGSHGSDTLFRVACKMVHGFELSDSDAVSVILSDFNPRCVPPWSDAEIERKVSDARTKCENPSAFHVEDRPQQKTAAPGERKKKETKGCDAVQLANRYVEDHATHPDGITLRRWRGDCYRWLEQVGCYTKLTDEQIEAELYRKLRLCKRSEVGDVRHALIAVTDLLIDHVELGDSLDGEKLSPAHDRAVTPNGVLHLPTLTITPATPRYFATSSLGVSYAAARPRR